MKSVLKISMYFGILAGFMFAAGIPQVVRQWSHSQSKSSVPQFTSSELATLEITPDNFFHYSDSLYNVRKNEIDKKGIYEPGVYFRDLKQFSMFKEKYHDTLNQDINRRNLIIAISNSIDILAGLRNENWKHALIGSKKITDAYEYWFPKEKESRIARAQEPPIEWWVNVIIPIMSWFFRFYLRGLPVAFILFLIWKFNLKKDFQEASYLESLDVKNAPVSFLLSLIVWPIIIGIDLRNRFNDLLMGADVISRRSKLLSLFSKQEEQLFELGKRMNRKEFRAYLDSIGMIQKHSFASALLVTLFLIIVPTSMFAQTTSIAHKEKVITMKSDYGGGGIHYDVVTKESAVLSFGEDMQWFPEFKQRIFYITDWLYEYLFVPDIGKVPLVLNRVLVTLI